MHNLTFCSGFLILDVPTSFNLTLDPSNVLGENDIMQWIKNAEASIQHEWFQKRPFAHLLGKTLLRVKPISRLHC